MDLLLQVQCHFPIGLKSTRDWILGLGFCFLYYSAFSLRSTGLKVEFKQRESMFKSPILGVTGSSRDETRAIGWFLKVTDCSIAGKAHISKKTAKDESV